MKPRLILGRLVVVALAGSAFLGHAAPGAPITFGYTASLVDYTVPTTKAQAAAAVPIAKARAAEAAVIRDQEISLAISAGCFGLVVGFMTGYAVRARLSYLHRRFARREDEVRKLMAVRQPLNAPTEKLGSR